MIKFVYNIVKIINISYISFKLNYGYCFQILYKNILTFILSLNQ